jgi:hypothetical protein
MRWNRKPTPRHGDKRIRMFFAWLPYRIDDETRWLETVCCREMYCAHWDGSDWFGVEFLPVDACCLRGCSVAKEQES